MEVLPSSVRPDDAGFGANRDAMQRLCDDLHDHQARAKRGGDESAQRRHREQGKLPVRERIDRLLDSGSHFSSSLRWRPTTCTTTKRRAPAW